MPQSALFDDLRHSAATILPVAGVYPKEVKAYDFELVLARFIKTLT